MLAIDKIKIEGTQSRVQINETTVSEYAEAINNGAQFPPVTVFFDGANFWLADGFHRLLAHKRAGKTEILETREVGGLRDAILYSVSANANHGLRRTNADKRKAVEMLLNDAEWAQWSDNSIAKQCAVSHTFVAGVRASYLATLQDSAPVSAVKTVKRGDTVYQQNTTAIGRDRTGRDIPPPAIPTAAEMPEEEDYQAGMSEVELLEQQIVELRDSLMDALAALKDLGNPDQEVYMTEMAKLRAELHVVTISRDALQNENAALKRHIKMLEKKLK